MTPDDLLARRTRLGLSQAGLGAALGIHANTIAQWERAERAIGHPVMLALALDALDSRAAVLRRTSLDESAGGAASPSQSFVPTMAAVLVTMHEIGVDQDEAVRLLGGEG